MKMEHQWNLYLLQGYKMDGCKNCRNDNVKYEEWSPDGESYYFCSKKCYIEFKNGTDEIYRAMPLEEIL